MERSSVPRDDVQRHVSNDALDGSCGPGLEPACIKACPTGCLHFGTKEQMVQIARSRAHQLKTQSGFANAGVYDPQSIGGMHVIYLLHDIAALLMLAGFIIHIYEGTAAQPGTFRSMVDGTVTEDW